MLTVPRRFSLDRALEGVRGLYFLVVPPQDAADPVSAAAERGQRVVDAAVAQGVEHVVLLSSVGAQHPSGTGPIVALHRIERSLRQSGIPSTFLRAAYFAENWGQVVEQVQGEGVLPTFLAPDTSVPTVDTRDIGRTAAELLVEGPRGTRVVELAGPTDPTPSQVAQRFSATLNRPVEVAAYPAQAATPALSAMGLPAPVAAMFGEMYEGIASGLVDFEGTPVRGRVPIADSLATLV